MISGFFSTKVVQTVPVSFRSRSHGKKYVLKMQFFKIFLSETTRPGAFIFGIKHHQEVLYQSCSNYAPGVKIDPAPGVTILHWIILGKFKTTSSLELLMGIWPNLTGIFSRWSPTKIVQIVLIDCISRKWGQNLGFQNAIFKNILVWKYNTQSFHIWYPLPKLSGQHYWSSVNGFTLTFSSGERPRALWALLFN